MQPDKFIASNYTHGFHRGMLFHCPSDWWYFGWCWIPTEAEFGKRAGWSLPGCRDMQAIMTKAAQWLSCHRTHGWSRNRYSLYLRKRKGNLFQTSRYCFEFFAAISWFYWTVIPNELNIVSPEHPDYLPQSAEYITSERYSIVFMQR